MSSIHDQLAEISANAAFEDFKAGSTDREDFTKLLALLWERHEPKMRELAAQKKVEYEIQIVTGYDFAIKEIEQDMLPPLWAEFHNQGQTFNWKYENETPFRYSFKFRWGCKRGVLLNELKRDWKAQQETEEASAKKQRLNEQPAKEPELKPLPEGTPAECPELPKDLHGYNVLFYSEWYGYIWGRVPEETDEYEEWIQVVCDKDVFPFRPEGEQYSEGAIQRSEIRDLRFAHKEVGRNGSTEF